MAMLVFLTCSPTDAPFASDKGSVSFVLSKSKAEPGDSLKISFSRKLLQDEVVFIDDAPLFGSRSDTSEASYMFFVPYVSAGQHEISVRNTTNQITSSISILTTVENKAGIDSKMAADSIIIRLSSSLSLLSSSISEISTGDSAETGMKTSTIITQSLNVLLDTLNATVLALSSDQRMTFATVLARRGIVDSISALNNGYKLYKKLRKSSTGGFSKYDAFYTLIWLDFYGSALDNVKLFCDGAAIATAYLPSVSRALKGVGDAADIVDICIDCLFTTDLAYVSVNVNNQTNSVRLAAGKTFYPEFNGTFKNQDDLKLRLGQKASDFLLGEELNNQFKKLKSVKNNLLQNKIFQEAAKYIDIKFADYFLKVLDDLEKVQPSQTFRQYPVDITMYSTNIIFKPVFGEKPVTVSNSAICTYDALSNKLKTILPGKATIEFVTTYYENDSFFGGLLEPGKKINNTSSAVLYIDVFMPIDTIIVNDFSMKLGDADKFPEIQIQPSNASDNSVVLLSLQNNIANIMNNKIHAIDTGVAYIEVKSQDGTKKTIFKVTVMPVPTAPAIVKQPQPCILREGEAVTLSVKVTGVPYPSLQWYLNNAPITSAKSETYTIIGAALSDSGVYTVKATNSSGSATSNKATITVLLESCPPTIITQPQSQTVILGQNVTFTLSVQGDPTPTIQWYKNGVALQGKCENYLQIEATQLSDSGSYYALATNYRGKDTSKSVQLKITKALLAASIGKQPTDQAVSPGQTALFSVTAVGNPAPKFLWYKNGAALPAETLSTLIVKNVQYADTGLYFVVAQNQVNSDTSAKAILTIPTVSVSPHITLQPLSKNVSAGQMVSFIISATGTPDPDCQWYKNGKALTGSTSFSLSLTLASVSDSGRYFAVVRNSAGCDTSTIATLTVVPVVSALAISSQPVSKTVEAGQPVVFSVVANGNPAPSYQWFRNGVEISGQNSSTITISTVKVSDTGSYTVLVKNSQGSVLSATAILKVVLPIGTQTYMENFGTNWKTRWDILNAINGSEAYTLDCDATSMNYTISTPLNWVRCETALKTVLQGTTLNFEFEFFWTGGGTIEFFIMAADQVGTIDRTRDQIDMYGAYISSSDTPYLSISGYTAGTRVFFSDNVETSSVYKNRWVRVNIVKEGVLWKFYRDGVLIHSATFPAMADKSVRLIVAPSHNYYKGASATMKFRKIGVSPSPNVSKPFATSLRENFDGDLSNWISYGTPLPLVIPSLQSRNGVFDNMGDPNCGSGLIGRQPVGNTNGFTIQSDVYLDVTNQTGCWAGTSIGLTQEIIDQSTSITDCSEPGSGLHFDICYSGDACWGEQPAYRRHAWLSCGLLAEDGTWLSPSDPKAPLLNADAYVNSWHTMIIRVRSDRYVEFSIDSSLIWVSTKKLKPEMLTGRNLISAGRSSGSAGKSYQDWVSFQ
jgi:hypothetical protein